MSVNSIGSINNVNVIGKIVLNANQVSDKGEVTFNSTTQADKNPKEIAQQLFDDISGLGTSKALESHLSQLTKDNIIQVLEQYKTISKSQGEEESLLEAIYGEMWGSRSTPKKYT